MILEALFFSIALSFDSFVAFLGYGTSKIKVHFKTILLMIVINTFILACGILIGFLFSNILNEDFSKYFSFSLLMIVGLIKFFSEIIKIWLNKKAICKDVVTIKIFNFKLFLNIAFDATKADLNKDKILSIKEAIIIGIILSIDSFGVGIGIGLSNLSPYIVIPFSFLTCLFFSCIGEYIGKKIAKKCSFNLSWISGLTLIIIAILKII